MVLGAGPYQVSLISRAAELGYEVVTIDYLPDNVGHSFGHHYVNTSTTDALSVLSAAKELAIDGIVTNSESSLPTAARVAEELVLPGPGTACVATMLNKAKFRAFQHQHGLDAPTFVSLEGGDEENVIDKLAGIQLPAIVKPADSSGSRGIHKVNELDSNKPTSAVVDAMSHSQSRCVCIESFREGIEVGGDGFLRDGELASLTLTEKHFENFIVTGHSIPTAISDSEVERIKEEIELTCKYLGYTSGYLNVDTIIGSDSVTILEMSPRLGGNGIHQLIQRATGNSPLDSVIRTAVGDEYEPQRNGSVSQHCGSFVFGSSIAGRLDHISNRKDLQEVVPEVFHLFNAFEAGEEVPHFTDAGSCLGFALFDLPTDVPYEEMTNRIHRAMNIRVTPESE